MVKKIKDLNVFKKGEPVVIDFYADWCNPCKMMLKGLNELSEDCATKIYKVNVDESPEIASKFGIMSIPTIGYFKTEDDFVLEAGAKPSTIIQKNIDKMYE